MPSRLFRIHGDFCASNPWEVIVTTITLTTFILFIDHRKGPILTTNDTNKYAPVDLVFMTLIRCLAVLYSYYHFRKLQKLGCRFVLVIAGLFTVFSSFVFTSALIKVLGVDLNELKDALFFFLLLIDLNKATTLAGFALTASNKEQLKTNIANGMSYLGPSITLDTLVEILVIGIGSLTGVRRLETLSYFACLSVIVNYIIFMTFYPACLSLILELTNLTSKRPISTDLIPSALKDEDKFNPVVQRVKLIMAFGLLLVHLRSRWNVASSSVLEEAPEAENQESFDERFLQWVTCSVDHIVILILLGALVVKFVFFEEKEIISGSGEENDGKELQMKYVQSEKCTQTEQGSFLEKEGKPVASEKKRCLEECFKVYKEMDNLNSLSDVEVLKLLDNKLVPTYQLEKLVDNPERGVRLRRRAVFANCISDIPFEGYDYSLVLGACCENVLGYIPVPLGIAGPLNLDGELLYVPMATTEGCLVASTNRGCRALLQNGVKSRITADGMTRGPVVRFPTATRAADASLLLETPEAFATIKTAFDCTSRFARLTRLRLRIAGRHVFLRFVATTGDAMGMNMVSKGAEAALDVIKAKLLPDMEVMSLSGNYCADKKSSAVNWVEGRGKSVVCEAVVPGDCIQKVLKTSVARLVELNVSKNLVGSAVAGSVGGFNAHAANMVTAVFIATGQDPAQNLTSSNCITLLEPHGDDGLHISCTMPSIEVGTVGGGTRLPAQAACLHLLGCKGGDPSSPGSNAARLARVVCATVLAGELSLLAALCSGHLVESHMRMNRSFTDDGRAGESNV